MQKRENAVSEALVSQFLAADVIVIGAPLYNFSIPSQLKSWIDRIAQAGRTFTYTDKGPKGLAGGKTVIVASTRGGVYSTSEGGRAMEHQESYLQTVFGFLGITDVRFVRAEGLAMGDAVKAQALAAAAQADQGAGYRRREPVARQPGRLTPRPGAPGRISGTAGRPESSPGASRAGAAGSRRSRSAGSGGCPRTRSRRPSSASAR